MQSINASEIRMRDQLREDLGRKVNDFLKSGTITKIDNGTVKTETRPQFNHIIATAPAKRAERQQEKEALHAAIAELSYIEIAGVTLIRSAHEVSALLRQRGFKLLSPSVRRIAESIGIALTK